MHYATCIHLTDDDLVKAIHMARSMDIGCSVGQSSTSNMLKCVCCGLEGRLSDSEFLLHFLEKPSHRICLRNGHPKELYCARCGDYQYSSLFDTLVKRERNICIDEYKPLVGVTPKMSSAGRKRPRAQSMSSISTVVEPARAKGI